MKNRKLVEIFNSLSKPERKDFRAFISSGLLKYNANVLMLLNYLVDNAPYSSDVKLDRELVHSHMFPEKKYNEQRLYDHLSYAQKATEEFLVYLHGRKNEGAKRRALMQELSHRHCDRNFEIVAKAHRRSYEKQLVRDPEFHFSLYTLEQLQDAFATRQARNLDGRLQEEAGHLDAFYLAAKLKNLCEMINRKNILQVEYDLILADEIAGHVRENLQRYQGVPAVYLYYQAYLTLTSSEETEHHELLISLLEQHQHQFPDEAVKGLYQFAQNYCIKRLNQGDTSYLEKLFSLYRKQIENGAIFQGRHINQFDYKNVVTVGLRLGENEYIEQFIDDFKSRLPASIRENAYSYNLASFYYETSEFSQALKVLQAVDFTDIYYELSGRSLLLKLYYEQEDTEALLALIDSFKMYLRRQKLVSEYQHTVHINLLVFTKKMLRLREQRPKRISEAFVRSVDELLQDIEVKGKITNLNWLKAQVVALKTD
jgi:hypothetical protein